MRVTEEKNPLLERRGFAEGHRAKQNRDTGILRKCMDCRRRQFIFVWNKLNSKMAFVANARPEGAIKLRTRILVLC